MRKYLCMDMKEKKTGKGNNFPTNCREVIYKKIGISCKTLEFADFNNYFIQFSTVIAYSFDNKLGTIFRSLKL